MLLHMLLQQIGVATLVLTVSLVPLDFSETLIKKNLDYNSVIEQFLLMEFLAAVPI